MTPKFNTGVGLGEVYPCPEFGCPNVRGTLFSWGMDDHTKPKKIRDKNLLCRLYSFQL